MEEGPLEGCFAWLRRGFCGWGCIVGVAGGSRMGRRVVGRGRIGRWSTLIVGIVVAVAVAEEVVVAVVEVAVGGIGREYADGSAAAAPVVGLLDVGDV